MRKIALQKLLDIKLYYFQVDFQLKFLYQKSIFEETLNALKVVSRRKKSPYGNLGVQKVPKRQVLTMKKFLEREEVYIETQLIWKI